MVKVTDKRKKTLKSANKSSKKEKVLKKSKTSESRGFYYSFFTLILILCLIQISISVVLNVSKIISYKSKIVQITKSRDAALAMNEQLKDSINNFSNVKGLEEIARNNLKMSSEDEVLVIINTPKEEQKEEKPKKTGFIKHD